MSKAFAGILAKKVSSNVLVVEGSVKNYLRVRVAYPLDEPLKSTVEVKVKGSGAAAEAAVGREGLKPPLPL